VSESAAFLEIYWQVLPRLLSLPKRYVNNVTNPFSHRHGLKWTHMSPHGILHIFDSL